MKTYAIIPAGGSGKRLSSNIPKQYITVEGKELIAYTLDVFQKNKNIDGIILSVSEDSKLLIEEIIAKYEFNKVIKVVTGGKERQDSVYNGLTSLSFNEDDLIVVHDAARPLLSQKILDTALEKASECDNIIVALKAKDTLVNGVESIENHVDRNGIWYVQTPQIFRYRILKESFDIAIKNNFCGTDESMLVKNASYNVKIVEGSSFNFKITSDSDLELFKLICNQRII